jgi:hypothetical protein
MKLFKKILIALAVIFVLIQFFRPVKNQSASVSADDIFSKYPAEENTKVLVRKACYDCHSNNTVYPWYAEIQPVAWWLSDHIKDGKDELNFSEFASYTAKKAAHKMDEVMDEVKEEKMPLKSYLITHTEARLTVEERKGITEWAEQLRNKINAAK